MSSYRFEGVCVMTDRERLIELIQTILDGVPYGEVTKYTAKNIADYLLDNGVVALPCNVGNTLWILFTVEKTIESREIESVMQRQKSWTIRFTNGDCFTVWDNAENEYFGKTVFLTKEEAEQALKEREKV